MNPEETEDRALFVAPDYSELLSSQQADRYATKIANQYHFVSLNKHSALWTYNPKSGIWTDDGEENIESYMRQHLLGEEFSSHLTQEIETAIRHQTYNETANFGGKTDEIVLQNGTLNLTTLGFSHEFNPESYHVAALPVSYDPNAKCPMFDRFLEQVIPDETDRKAIIEFFGYCLFKSYIYAIVVLLVGSGANGKSILLSILRSFLGADNVTAVTPQQMYSSQFASSRLYHKLANIAGDIPASAIKDTGTLKLLSGEDMVTAQQKYREPFEFNNYAKLIFAANQTPETLDSSNAFHRRFHIIDLPNTFNPTDPGYIPGDKLKASLTTPEELSGMLNEAIDGLKRLMQQGDLSGTTTVEDRKLDYINRSDPAHYFLMRFVKEDADNPCPIPRDTLYKLYTDFCHSTGRVPKANTVFGKKVKQFVPFVDERKTRDPDSSSDKQEWRYYGVRFDQAAYDKETAHSGQI